MVVAREVHLAVARVLRRGRRNSEATVAPSATAVGAMEVDAATEEAKGGMVEGKEMAEVEAVAKATDMEDLVTTVVDMDSATAVVDMTSLSSG